jgi:hypothetical protein
MYAIDVSYAAAAPSTPGLVDRISDQWLAMANMTDGRARGLALAQAGYWRSVRDAARRLQAERAVTDL